MRAPFVVLNPNLEVLPGMEWKEASIYHVEFDKLIVKAPDLEFELWHRNIIFEGHGLRITGFALVGGIMGKVECWIDLGP